MKKLFKFQKQMVAAAAKNSKGVFQAPTGAGKTIVQADIATRCILEGGTPLIVVRASRISLCNQLIGEYVTYALSNGVKRNEIDTLLFHSGADVEIEGLEETNLTIHATTSATELLNKIRLQKSRKAIVVGVTYHSSVVLNDALTREGITIDLDMNDEAHYLVQRVFQESVILFPKLSKRQYFFTATPRYTESNEGRGMNNESIFGKMLSRFTVKEMVDLGRITYARYAEVYGTTQDPTNSIAVDNFITEVMGDLRKQNGGQASKLLVATTGTSAISDFIVGDAFVALRKQNVNIVSMASAVGLMTVNGVVVSRETAMASVRKFGDASCVNDLVVLHFDMLSEGIDVPGLNGVLIMRKMSESKFYQTVGRVIRTAPGKQYGMVYFPNVNDADLVKDFTEKMKNMRLDGYYSAEFLQELENGDAKEIVIATGERESMTATFASDLRIQSEIEETAATYSLDIF
jgi:superfamily II DNA or RNA helicase